MNTTVKDLLARLYPNILNKWDRWDYKIYGPLSFEDNAEVSVLLFNQDRSYQTIQLQLAKLALDEPKRRKRL